MQFKKMKVKVDNGCTYVFVKKDKYIGVTVYDQEGKRICPTQEVIEFNEPVVGQRLSFSYDAGITTDVFETSTNIVSIEKE